MFLGRWFILPLPISPIHSCGMVDSSSCDMNDSANTNRRTNKLISLSTVRLDPSVNVRMKKATQLQHPHHRRPLLLPPQDKIMMERIIKPPHFIPTHSFRHLKRRRPHERGDDPNNNPMLQLHRPPLLHLLFPRWSRQRLLHPPRPRHRHHLMASMASCLLCPCLSISSLQD